MTRISNIPSRRIQDHATQQQVDATSRAINQQVSRVGVPLVRTYYAEVTADISTTTTTADYETLVRINLTSAGGRLHIRASSAISRSGGGTAHAALFVNGNRVQASGSSSGTTAVHSLEKDLQLPKGNHRIELRWAVTGGGTLSCNPITSPDSNHASLTVQEIN